MKKKYHLPKFSIALTPTSSLIISKSSLHSNLLSLKEKAKNSWVYAVLKADGYGLGAGSVAKVIEDDVAGFCVATETEGANLRESGIQDKPILILDGPSIGNLDAYLEYNLTPVINGRDQLDYWNGGLASHNGDFFARRNVILQFDLGFNRLGLYEKEIDLIDLSKLNIAMIMGHLSCADTPDSENNMRELNNFSRLFARFPGIPRSLAASSGVFLGKDFHFEFIRPGIAIYGGHKEKNIKPVVSFDARVLRLTNLKKGEKIGYGQTYQTQKNTSLATIALGYADGFLRSAGNGWQARYKGIDLPIVGRVSMDLITVDATDAVDIKVGEWVSLLDETQTINDFASHTGSIPYEVITSISKRVPRIWRH